MGLDQYLYAKVSGNSLRKQEGEGPTPLEIAAESVGLKDNAGKGNYGHVAIERQVGYWRKANAIHNWFVTNVQDGVDECQRSDVEVAQLVELRELCEKVLATAKVEEGEPVTEKDWSGNPVTYTPKTVTNPQDVIDLLPPTSGFFFGSTDVDEWFLEDVKHTIDVVKHCEELREQHDWNVNFAYRSSW